MPREDTGEMSALSVELSAPPDERTGPAPEAPPAALPEDAPETAETTGEAPETAEAADRPKRRGVDWAGVGRRWTPRLLPPMAYLGASFYFAQHFWADPQHRVYGTADGILFAWYFKWVEQCIIHFHNPFISTSMAVPDGVNVMWNTAVLMLAVVFSPLTATIGATATVGALESLSPAFSAITAYFVLRRLTGSSVGAALGATLFGFGPFFVSHTGHLHLLFAPFIPLAVLVGHQLVVRQDKSAIRTGALLGVLVGVQMLISEEMVVLAAIGVVCALIAAVITCPRDVLAKFRHAAIGVGVGAGTALVICGVALYYQFLGPNALKDGFHGPQSVRADLATLVRPNAQQYYHTRADLVAAHHYPTGAESTAYLGWPLIALSVGYAVWLITRRNRFGIWWLLTTLGVVVLCLGSPMQVNTHRIGPGPWAVVRNLPLLDGALPVRLSLITLLLVGGLIALALSRFRGWWLVLATAVVALALVPLRPYGPYRTRVLPETPAFFTSSAVGMIPKGTNVLIMPYASYPNAAPMLWQIHAEMRFDIVGGYSVFNNRGRQSYWPEYPSAAGLMNSFTRPRQPATADERIAGLDSLHSAKIRYIIITSDVRREPQVAQAAADITGCQLRPVKDVTICAVPA